MGDVEDFDKKKSHSQRHSGRKAEKKEAKNKHVQDLTAQQRNPKAFAFQSVVKAQRRFVRTQDIKSKKHHIPVVDRTPLEPPPVVVAVVGGPKVGKTTLLRCLIKNYTNQRLSDIQGPVTIVVGKKRRLTFIEVNNDVNCMIDIAKVADIVLMIIDATFGIEMEVFEFLEICRAHGTPRVMGILNHLDMLRDNKSLKKKKKALKHRFQVELYPGAKLFYFSGLIREEYLKNDIKNLGRFISVMKFRPLTWRTSHPYVIVDRYEDITNPERIREEPKCDREVVLYGYVRGISFQQSQAVHIPGCGDFKIKDMSFLPDPCPLPEHLKKRSLNAKERLTYAPMSGVGGVMYDKDAVYIDLGGSHHPNKVKSQVKESDDEEEGVLQPLLDLQKTANEKQAQSRIQLFSHSKFIANETKDANEEEDTGGITDRTSSEGLPLFETVTDNTGRVRRRALFNDNLENNVDELESDDDDDEDGETSEEEEEEDIEDEDGETSDEEEEEDVNDISPPKKKFKNDSGVESDSEDYDLDSDLLDIQQHNLALKVDSEVKEPAAARKIMPLSKNKDSDISQKIQGILEKINTSQQNTKMPSTTNKCKILDDDEEEEEEENKDIGLSNDGKPSSSVVQDKGEESEGTNSSTSDEDEDEKGKEEYRMEMFKQATSNFYKNQSTVSFLRKYIYGEIKEEEENRLEEEEEDFGGLFRRTSKVRKPGELYSVQAVMDDTDTSRYIPPVLQEWGDSEVRATVMDCFVTGDWKDRDAQTLLKMDDEDNLYGDFEDLETGSKFSAQTDQKQQQEEENKDGKDEVQEPKKEKSAKEKLLEKKRRLKEMFDSEYDDKGGDHFDNLKAEMSQQAQLNRAEFEGLDDQLRVQYEGFRPGLYVRMEFSNFPCEFITNFDASYPVIVGGLLENETNMGFIRVRIKVHRWYPKILKNRDPLILSLGWRRFQSPIYYAKREDNFRLRSLKYARKYLHIEAMLWGPVTQVNTGFVALQNITDRVPEFRIAANGVVLETDKSSKIVKKLKFIGTPEKILRKTAFIKDMFNSETEVAKFVGAKVQTQSGIRGIIKKFKGRNGLFRATFEDMIKMSDVVVLKTWVPLELAQHCFPVRSLLLPSNEKAAWQGMRTVAQIKKDKGIKALPNPDSFYTEITSRREYIPLPLRVPKDLQKSLPYHLKPKVTPKAQKEQRVVVVKNPQEVQMDTFMKRLKVMMEDRIEKEEREKTKKKQKFQKDIAEREHMRLVREKRRKAAICKYKDMIVSQKLKESISCQTASELKAAINLHRAGDYMWQARIRRQVTPYGVSSPANDSY
ncbi:hypothetical protein Pcinc_037266 [Petrolisthes cinctipes]|uniref:Bms1-type G domain-containing protein n=1 Tax=Petrolisthes cinctipes TaxID=88211 RepID=A0AAE1BT81_PETCI|nr:hypothetical protein Pcinc_037266 [Petrolisthes cinctipes]